MAWRVAAHQRFDPMIGFSIHDSLLIVPPVPVPAKLPHASFNVEQGLFLGANISNVSGREAQGFYSALIGRGNGAGCRPGGARQRGRRPKGERSGRGDHAAQSG